MSDTAQSTRRREAARILYVLLVTAAVALLGSCTPSSELGGAEIPNALPNTYLSGQHSSLNDPRYVVKFFWHGSDPDGDVVGYQWKISNNGTDGINIEDTLTVDPATGDTLNPWLFTVATDTIIYVTADLPGYPEDAGLDTLDQRFYQTHSVFVRAIDEMGGVDPTPAFRHFTATTFIPFVDVDRPARLSGYRDAQAVPPTATFGFTGADPDYELGEPTKYRVLWKEAFLDDPPHYVRTRYEYESRIEDLVDFADSSWSEWMPYPSQPEDRLLRFPDQPRVDAENELIYYIFAIQVQDTAGAVSLDRIYARNVQNVYVSEGMTPLLTIYERSLGSAQATGVNAQAKYDIAQGQLLEFSWVGNASRYAGLVESYRFGWDLIDAADENDPNWAVLPGNSMQHRRASPISFGSGTHTLTIQCVDNSGQLTRMTYIMDVVPVPDPEAQSPLLLIDDVSDQTSNAWPGRNGQPLDRDRYRDSFWETVLSGGGGVAGYDPETHVFDLQNENLRYRDVVNYRVVLWSTRFSADNYVWSNFKPLPDGSSQFNWLNSYQETVGNVFLVGSRVLNEFLDDARWMVPWIFETSETIFSSEDHGAFQIGFGQEDLPDGSTILRGLERYPYKAFGLAVLDQVSPKYNIYGEGGLGVEDRRSSRCVGVKGLILDNDFKARYMPEGGYFPDTILTSNEIDWEDDDEFHRDNLGPWVWGNDEFYDANITSRTTIWESTDCGDELCIDPMFRIYSRLDWVKDLHIAEGDSTWPAYGQFWFDTRCGMHAMDLNYQHTKTFLKPTAFVSHKLEELKPSGVGDVVWGFDPYRFEPEGIGDAIQWVLGEHFGLLMQR